MLRALRCVVFGCGLLVGVLCCMGAASAGAASPKAGWGVESFAAPTDFSSADNATCLRTVEGSKYPACDLYLVTVRNAGATASPGGSVVVRDVIPEGLSVQRVSLFWSGAGQLAQFGEPFENLNSETDLASFIVPIAACSTPAGSSGGIVECSLASFVFTALAKGEKTPEGLKPDETLKMFVYVTVKPKAAGTLMNKAEAAEVTEPSGGVPNVAVEKANAVSSGAPPFSLSNFEFNIDGTDGLPDTQAGGHAYELQTNIGFNNSFRSNAPEIREETTDVQDVKDLLVDLPLGFIGSTLAAPECTLAQLSGQTCPSDAIVGHIKTEPLDAGSVDSPIYNLVPEHGSPAEFGYIDVEDGAHAFYARVVPTPEGYVLQTRSPDIPQVDLRRVEVTFYGDPAAKQEELALREGKTPTPLAQVPFFTNPTDCSGKGLVATVYMDSWQNPGTYTSYGAPNLSDGKWVSATSESPPVTGCDQERFSSQLAAQPTTHEADKPSGLAFELKVPQTETVGVPATPTLKEVVTTLPEGLTADPSAGSGLAACSEAQIGWEEAAEGPLRFNAAPPACPESSKIGTLELETPLIPHKLEGVMYLASQNANPFGTTLATYVVVDDPITGVLVKIAGKLLPDMSTGRLRAVFEENPNLPFSDLKLHFFGGPRAELATPENCGTYTTTTEWFPYSYPDSGPPSTPFDSFLINEACPNGFSPEFAALSSNVQAGAYTPFEASFERSDKDQELAGLSVTLPAGLLGKITGIPLCSDAEIRAAEVGDGGCPGASEVGSVVAGAGPGPDPLFVSGKAYLTGPYNGGPYGLAVVVPAVAGPFNFGTVVVRQAIRIDPHTARVTDVSDPFPTIIDGIPLRLRRVDVTLNRPQFAFNPTNCSRLEFTGSITGSPLGAPRALHGTVGYATQTGASAPVSAPFQVTDCRGLKFQPRFQASVKAQSSRLNGASLTVKVSYPNAAWGTEANIRRVKVSLPKQLPSRLKTLQKACTASQFNANPAGCPAASIVGHAIVHTPVLPAPLEGPAYFVSNGNQAFPNLIMVLQGNNVTVQLIGNTFISKAGITSSTFNGVPDVPFRSFQVTLPQGRYSALAANLPGSAHARFCGQKLKMPTVLNAQNGATLEQTTSITVTGCRKHARRARRATRHTAARHRGRRG